MFLTGVKKTKKIYQQQGYRIKYKVAVLGLNKVNWKQYDFHLTPVITFTHVEHPSGKGSNNTISIECGHWAIGLHRMKLDI